jgi:hypothetical protein
LRHVNLVIDHYQRKWLTGAYKFISTARAWPGKEITVSEVKRWYIGVYNGEAQARVCAPHPHEFIRDTEGETFVIAEQFDACEARNRALQQRLTAADERNDLAIDLLRRARAVIAGGGWADLERDIAKFLKP